MLQLFKKIFNTTSHHRPGSKPADVHTQFEDNPDFDLDVLLHEMNDYFLSNPLIKDNYKVELGFLESKLKDVPTEDRKYYAIIPYLFTLEFDYNSVPVYRDEKAGMYYVLLDGKRLYYHKGFTNSVDVQKAFTFISLEQHPDSPHRYLDDFFQINADDIVADIGAAEGNFSLMVIDKIKELIIVEANPVWIEALYKTFEPWKHKVKIVNKFVGTKNDEITVTLDKLKGEKHLSAIKMDIEGAELSVLQSSESYIRDNNIKMAVTVYHNHSDANDIRNFLVKNGYKTGFSKGFMLFIFDKLRPPYFRHGLIKANNGLQ